MDYVWLLKKAPAEVRNTPRETHRGKSVGGAEMGNKEGNKGGGQVIVDRGA